MKIKPFLVEEWMNANENDAVYNIAETCVDSISLDELFALTGEDKAAFFAEFSAKRLTYGAIEGALPFKRGVASLYAKQPPEHIIPTHGAAGANHLVIESLVEPGDRVISVTPTYQQLYSIPESLGANVIPLPLRPENGYLPDLDELRSLAAGGAKLICINNPNNPSGALMSGDMLRAIVDIARKCGAYLLCDEVYRHLNQQEAYVESAADLYEKGISVSSMSKVFSLAGLRLGWLATPDADVRRACLSQRDYSLISCGMFDEAVAGVALAHADQLLARNRALIRENLAMLDAWIQAHPHFHYVKPQAGTTALIHYDYDVDSRTFCERLLRETGAFLTPGECFGLEKCARIGYACDSQVLRDGLAQLDRFAGTL